MVRERSNHLDHPPSQYSPNMIKIVSTTTTTGQLIGDRNFRTATAHRDRNPHTPYPNKTTYGNSERTRGILLFRLRRLRLAARGLINGKGDSFDSEGRGSLLKIRGRGFLLRIVRVGSRSQEEERKVYWDCAETEHRGSGQRGCSSEE